MFWYLWEHKRIHKWWIFCTKNILHQETFKNIIYIFTRDQIVRRYIKNYFSKSCYMLQCQCLETYTISQCSIITNLSVLRKYHNSRVTSKFLVHSYSLRTCIWRKCCCEKNSTPNKTAGMKLPNGSGICYLHLCSSYISIPTYIWI